MWSNISTLHGEAYVGGGMRRNFHKYWPPTDHWRADQNSRRAVQV